MLILFYGTSIFNAPNAGSVLLDGHWYSFGIDCSHEYEAILQEKRKEGKMYDDHTLKNTDTSCTLDYYSDSDDLVASLLGHGQFIQ